MGNHGVGFRSGSGVRKPARYHRRMTYRVLMTDRPWPDETIERTILEAAGCELTLAPSDDEPTLVRHAADADAIATC